MRMQLPSCRWYLLCSEPTWWLAASSGSSRRVLCWQVRSSFWSALLLKGLRSSRLWTHGHVSLRRLSEVFRLSSVAVALFALGNLVHYFLMASYLAVLCLVFGCCLWSAVIGFSGEPGVNELHTFSTSTWTRILRCFFLRSHAESRSVLS